MKRATLAILALLCLGAGSGQASHLLISPNPPVQGTLTTFTWSGSGEYVSAYIACSDTESFSGVVQDDGAPVVMDVTFSNATSCVANLSIFSYSGTSGKYQQKFAQSSFVVGG